MSPTMPLAALKRAGKGLLASRAGWTACAPLRTADVVALTYHRIPRAPGPFEGMAVDDFRRHMRWVRSHCTPVRPEEVPDAARLAGRIRPPVLVTFDDGYRDYHDCAYPVLAELRIPAVVFLATAHIDHGGLLWTEAMHWAAATSPRASLRLPWSGEERALGDREDRLRVSREVNAHLKGVEDAERRRLHAELLAALGAPDPLAALDRQMMSWDEVRAAREWTTFGGHTHTHPILSRVSQAVARAEVAACRDRIAAEVGTPPRYFAYPNGRAVDFDASTRQVLADHGFEAAFTTVHGAIRPGAEPFALPRVAAWGHTDGDVALLVARA